MIPLMIFFWSISVVLFHVKLHADFILPPLMLSSFLTPSIFALHIYSFCCYDFWY
jgi:hypothetical protein